ncbi:UDP-glycosyltransferase UGT5 [Hyalella azteca]|uniref:UDP-glucuronosyltransferase n=1 Tax=Hyalella azteca TaxID=294128 RepID=A0A8B7NJS0_HYAAZ|nr:UDP-glycosyltransferase UGT5 [Hyalella azteca]
MTLLRICLLIASAISCATSSKVLMVLPLGSASHKNIFTPIAQKLGEKGHDVTVVSMYSSNFKGSTAPAYNDIVAETARQQMINSTGEFNVFQMYKESENINSQVMKKVIKNIHVYCEAFLKDPAVQSAWMNKPDLIMLPAFMNECGLAFVHKFQVPFIYVTTSGLTPWTADIMGNPENPAFVPNQYLPYTDEMSLWQRVINSVFRIVSPIARRHLVLNRLEKVVKEFLKDEHFSLEEVERNASVVLVNSHHSLGFPRPMTPNVIEVGGMHCRPSKDLQTIDPELSHFLDVTGEKNAILFSLGSHIKSSSMPEDVLSMFVNVFNRLPYGERPSNLSSNVITRPWLPQQDVLGHPAIGAFFTHGGLLSLQETAYHGVPIVALPLMSDQTLNAKQAESIGMATVLELKTLSEQNIEDAILRVMNNPSYGKEARRRSVIMKDQETHPLDRAVYWTEYVMRHQGAAHLKSKAANLSIVQYFLIDVGFVLLVIALSTIFIIYVTSKLILKWIKNFVKGFVLRFMHNVAVHQSK